MPKRENIVKYTDRDFDSIKESLVNYAKRYYPSTYQDFNEAGFGALMTDYVAYIGDIMSFYLDYQTNESFLDSAMEFENVIRIAKTLGYKFKYTYTSQGVVSLYATIPASSTDFTGINTDYAPTIKKGTVFATDNDEAYTLIEDVNFADPTNQKEVAVLNESTGLPTYYAVRATGRVISGQPDVAEIPVGDFERFRKATIEDDFITEIVSVIDSDGNEYFEVDNLSQNVVYKEVQNPNAPTDLASSIMKPKLVTRRFAVDTGLESTTLQFGYGSERSLTSDTYGRPENVVVQKFGRPYVSSTSFDPSNLIENDKFGISPVNTVLTINYIKNSSLNPNAAKGALKRVTDLLIFFPGTNNVSSLENFVAESLISNNEEPIVGSVSIPDSDELRTRAVSYVASQKRAVTKEDYEALCYAMPSSFGAIKRVRTVQDKKTLRKNLNLYVISEDRDGNFIETNSTIKSNLKTWLTRHKMITDTIDILDAKIVNVAINFTVVADVDRNKYDVLNSCIANLENLYKNKFNVGEPLFYGDVYRELKNVDSVLDVTEVFATVQQGGEYSSSGFSITQNLSTDGRAVLLEDNQIFEIKFFNRDLVGTVL